MFAGGERVQRREFLGCEANRDDLRGLCSAAWPTAAASLQLVDVAAGFGLVGPDTPAT